MTHTYHIAYYQKKGYLKRYRHQLAARSIVADYKAAFSPFSAC